MKRSAGKPLNRFAQRALQDFYQTMLEQLTQVPFEKLTVNRICDRCGYPRSTFYNYFDDLYDLLDYCWERIAQEAAVTGDVNIPQRQQTAYLFERLYSYMDTKRDMIRRLLAHNGENGAMLHSLNRFLRKSIYQMVLACPEDGRHPLPCELIAEHYGSTVQMLLSWSFLRRDPISREEALVYLDFLLGTLEKKEAPQ